MPGEGAIVAALAIALGNIQAPGRLSRHVRPGASARIATLIGVIPVTAVANWFYQKRARAIGIVNMCLQLGASALVVIYQLLIEEFGWRTAFEMLGVLIVLLVVIPGSIILRRSAEDVGMHLDGVDPASGSGATAQSQRAAASTHEHNWAFHDAVRTKSLWLVIGTFSTAVMAGGGIAFHMVAYYTDIGISPTFAAASLSLYAFSGALASGLWGYLAERIAPRQLSAIAFGAATLGIFLFSQIRGEWMGLGVAVFLGLAAVVCSR